VIHFNSFATCIFCSLTEGAVLTSHENDLEQDHTWGTGFTAWMAQIVSRRATDLHKAALLTTPSQHYAKFYSDLLELPVYPLKAGVALGTFDRQLTRQARARRSRRPAIEVLLPARFDPHQKGHDVAMEACRILKQRGIPANFTFSGLRGDYEHRLEAFQESAAAKGVGDRVVAKRFSDIRRAYEQCDVVISPERFCSYGLSISEALALGIPTALADIPTYREIANTFAHALFFDVAHPKALADAIIDAARIPEEICETEAVRFRVENDLRQMAVSLTQRYDAVSRSSTAG